MRIYLRNNDGWKLHKGTKEELRGALDERRVKLGDGATETEAKMNAVLALIRAGKGE